MELFIFFLWPTNFSSSGQQLRGLFRGFCFRLTKSNLSPSHYIFILSLHLFFFTVSYWTYFWIWQRNLRQALHLQFCLISVHLPTGTQSSSDFCVSSVGFLDPSLLFVSCLWRSLLWFIVLSYHVLCLIHSSSQPLVSHQVAPESKFLFLRLGASFSPIISRIRIYSRYVFSLAFTALRFVFHLQHCDLSRNKEMGCPLEVGHKPLADFDFPSKCQNRKV